MTTIKHQEIYIDYPQEYKKEFLKECNSCDSDINLKEIEGYLVCVKCGLIASDKVIEDVEWTNYTNDGCLNNKSRCGKSYENDINPYIPPLVTYMPRGFKTTVYKNGEKYNFDISRLHLQHSYNHLQLSYNKVENILECASIEKYSFPVQQTSKILWSEIMKDKKLTRAGVRKGLIACCLYYSCINHDSPRTPIEICKDFGMNDTKQFNKGDKEFKNIFENKARWSHLLTKTLSSEDYFIRYCNMLKNEGSIGENVSFAISKKCKIINDKLDNKISCYYPKSIAAGIIYYVCKQEGVTITMNRIAHSLDICAPTLSKVVKSIKQLIDKLEIIESN